MTSERKTFLAIDPGTTESAWVSFVQGAIAGFAKESNTVVLRRVRYYVNPAAHVVVEKLENYGKVTGQTILETQRWCGRFEQAYVGSDVDRSHCWLYIPRRVVKLELCGESKANDSAVRMAVADLYGGPKLAKGSKLAPGPLYGIKADIWQALALGIAHMRLLDQESRSSSPA